MVEFSEILFCFKCSQNPTVRVNLSIISRIFNNNSIIIAREAFIEIFDHSKWITVGICRHSEVCVVAIEKDGDPPSYAATIKRTKPTILFRSKLLLLVFMRSAFIYGKRKQHTYVSFGRDDSI